jgi:uncharacterized RDD family membrane protein YckC
MFCPACGTPAAADDRFCQSCGKPLPVTSADGPEDGSPSATDTSSFPRAPDPAQGSTGGPPPPIPAPEVPYSQAPPPPPGAAPAYPTYPGAQPPPPFGVAPTYPPYQGSGVPFPLVAPTAGGRLSTFGVPLARWWQRVGAMVLDSLIIGIPLAIVNAILNAALGTVHVVKLINGTYGTQRSIQGPAHVFIVIGTVVVAGLYFAILNGTHSGQTVGNRAPGIAVRDATTGEVIGFKRGLLRWFIRSVLYLALILPGILNDLFPLWDDRNQTIADKAAHSVVIRLK